MSLLVYTDTVFSNIIEAFKKIFLDLEEQRNKQKSAGKELQGRFSGY